MIAAQTDHALTCCHDLGHSVGDRVGIGRGGSHVVELEIPKVFDLRNHFDAVFGYMIAAARVQHRPNGVRGLGSAEQVR